MITASHARLRIRLTLNGRPVTEEVAPWELLLDFLRTRWALTGAKRSCDLEVCGACTVLVDGAPVSSCCFLAVDADGREVLTIEGFAEHSEFARFATAFADHGALQCGFCTPGMVLTLKAALDAGELTDEEAVRRALAGNLCRCTGYVGILKAARDLAGWAGSGQ